ncbi:MAG: hypothetical protein IPL65_05595 [Lewinellaceae bacterium]|nr:hypothetical protein [Lewinellaceae bacterium]
MYRVDGALEGFVRDSGLFATTPNYLYKIRQAELPGGGLEEKATYRLIIEKADGTPMVTAETAIPGDFRITIPNPSAIPPKITIGGYSSSTVQWNTDINGLYFNVYWRVRWREVDGSGSLIKRDTIDWLAASNVKRASSPSGAGGIYAGITSVSGRAFYQLLLENIPASSSKYRYFDGLDITLEGGGREIEDYLVTAQANSGLTGAEVFPSFTNIEPEGAGYGIFTGKSRFEMSNVRITAETIDSMKVHPQAKSLNFQ